MSCAKTIWITSDAIKVDDLELPAHAIKRDNGVTHHVGIGDLQEVTVTFLARRVLTSVDAFDRKENR